MLHCQKLCKNKNTAVAKYTTKSVQYIAKLGILQKTPSVNFSSAGTGLSVPLGLAAFTIDQCLLLLFCKSLPFLPVLSAAVQQRETVLRHMGQGLIQLQADGIYESNLHTWDFVFLLPVH